MAIAELLQRLAEREATVAVEAGRVGVRPRPALTGLEPALKEHKARLHELASAAGGVLPPERLAELAQELAEPQPALGPDFERPKRQTPGTCPGHWLRVPELPRRWQDAPRVDEDGLGCLYRYRAGGRWYLLKFLPPFDGRLSLTDTSGRVRVLPSVGEALEVLELLAGEPEP